MKVKASQYGSVIMQRGKCLECGDNCLVAMDGRSVCCRAEVELVTEGIIKKEIRTNNRRQPSNLGKRNLLIIQEGRCYWCGRKFGDFVVSKSGKAYELKPHWDHYIPFSFTGSSEDDQFVASCKMCNSHKSAKIIFSQQEEDDMKGYLKRRFYIRGWQDIEL